MPSGRAVLDRPVEVHRADAEIAAAGGEQLADELVVGLVLGERRPDPAVIRLRGVGPEVDGKLRLDPQHVAPLHRPVIGKLVPLRAGGRSGPPLVLRVRVLEERPCFLRGGQRADQVQIDAADEHGVGAEDGPVIERLESQQKTMRSIAPATGGVAGLS